MPDASSLSIIRDRTLLLTATGGSLLVSCWQLLTHEVINRDGIRYVAAAEAIVAGDLHAAFDAFHWPFHALLIALLHMATGWSVEACGYALIPPLHLIVVFTFLAVLRELGGSKPVLWAGLALVLVHPGLNETLPQILRDQGYWAFWLLSLLFFIRYFKHKRWSDAVIWTCCGVFSLLFRIEGVVFLALLPLALLGLREERWLSRLAILARAYVPTACLLAMVFGVLALWGRDALMLEQGRLIEPAERVRDVWASVVEGINDSGRELGETLLPRYSRNHGPIAMWVVLAYIAAIESIRAVHVAYAGLALAMVLLRRLLPSSRVGPVLWHIIAINVLLIGGFVLSEFYLSMRYAVGLTFSVMLLASFGLGSLWLVAREQVSSTWQARMMLPAIVTTLVLVGASGLISIGPRKFHERAAGEWLQANIPEDTQVYFDDIRTQHYAGRPYVGGVGQDWLRVRSLLQSGGLAEYELLVLHFSRRWPDRIKEARTLIGTEPLQRFENNRGDCILIFPMATAESESRD